MLQDIIQTTAALVTDLLKKFKQITKIIFISNQIKIWTIASLKQAIKCKSSTVKTVLRQKLQNGCPTWSVHNAHFHQNQQKIKLRMRKYKQTNKTALLWKKKLQWKQQVEKNVNTKTLFPLSLLQRGSNYFNFEAQKIDFMLYIHLKLTRLHQHSFRKWLSFERQTGHRNNFQCLRCSPHLLAFI